MFNIFRTNGIFARTDLGRYPTAEAALASLTGVVCAEEDEQHPGYWDAIDNRGSLYVIEPVESVEA